MLIVLQGNDQRERQERRKDFVAKYKEDDFNFTEFNSDINILDFTAAMEVAPMMSDHYFVLATVNKKQFIRIKDYVKPSSLTVLLLILEDFMLTTELQEGLSIDSLITCRQPTYKDSVKWIQQRAKQLGFKMDLEDRKKLALMFQTTKELEDVLFQMSMLPEYKRGVFFEELFSTRQKFVWELFIELVEGKKKNFFSKYAVQVTQNSELAPNQLNMRIVGGLLYCLERWKDSPSWIYERLQDLEDKEESLCPFLYTYLVEIMVIARKVRSNIPVLMKFVEVLDLIRKI